MEKITDVDLTGDPRWEALVKEAERIAEEAEKCEPLVIPVPICRNPIHDKVDALLWSFYIGAMPRHEARDAVIKIVRGEDDKRG